MAQLAMLTNKGEIMKHIPINTVARSRFEMRQILEAARWYRFDPHLRAYVEDDAKVANFL